MPKYSFIAKSQKGEPYSDIKDAKDERDLAKALRQEGYILISASVEKERRSFSFGELIPISGGVSFKEKMLFTRSLRVMIGAGVSLPKSLNILSNQTKSKVLKKTLLEIEGDIVKGGAFSEAILKHPRVFSEFFYNMVRVGEESGTLENNITILSRQMEGEQDLKTKIKSAMVYPAVIISAMTGIGIMMLIVVVPKLSETFAELGLELPITTRIVIGLGNFLAERWYLALFALFILFILARAVLKTRTGKKASGFICLKAPIISPIVKKTNSAYMVRNLSSLITAGIPLTRALEIISNTLGNFYYKKAISGAVEAVRKGEKLSKALKHHRDLFPLTVTQMIEVGEETGETGQILEKLGDFFEEEVAVATKNLATIVEPVLMLIIGGVIGFFAISMIQPMYSMLEGVK